MGINIDAIRQHGKKIEVKPRATRAEVGEYAALAVEFLTAPHRPKVVELDMSKLGNREAQVVAQGIRIALKDAGITKDEMDVIVRLGHAYVINVALSRNGKTTKPGHKTVRAKGTADKQI